jgi:hypothetical protein
VYSQTSVGKACEAIVAVVQLVCLGLASDINTHLLGDRRETEWQGKRNMAYHLVASGIGFVMKPARFQGIRTHEQGQKARFIGMGSTLSYMIPKDES